MDLRIRRLFFSPLEKADPKQIKGYHPLQLEIQPVQFYKILRNSISMMIIFEKLLSYDLMRKT